MQYFLRFSFFALSLTAGAYAHRIDTCSKDNVIGVLTHTPVGTGQHLIDVAEQHAIGVDNLLAANPNIPAHAPRPGTQFLLPTQYILPKVRSGIVINLPEKRLYYFAQADVVYIFPVAIGRLQHNSATGTFKITEKRYQPTWNIPASVRKEERLKGNHLPAMIAPGPENPLGDYAMRLSHGTILIHSTNFPPSIGKRSTSGCFGMYPDDIKVLYALVPVGTSVTVIDEAVKTSRSPEGFYIESHPTIQQTTNQHFRRPTGSEIHMNIRLALEQYPQADPLALYAVFSQNMGIPVLIGKSHARTVHHPRSTYRH